MCMYIMSSLITQEMWGFSTLSKSNYEKALKIVIFVALITQRDNFYNISNDFKIIQLYSKGHFDRNRKEIE